MADTYQEQLRDAAFRYAEYGWPVAPGGRPARPRRDGWPAPQDTTLPYHGPMSTNDIARYWQHHPHPVLLHTGPYALDVFRLPERIATPLLHQLTTRSQRGPVAILPNHQWLFLITAHDPPPEELNRRTIHYHGPNNWIPAPPTRIRNTPSPGTSPQPASAGNSSNPTPSTPHSTNYSQNAEPHTPHHHQPTSARTSGVEPR